MHKFWAAFPLIVLLSHDFKWLWSDWVLEDLDNAAREEQVFERGVFM